MIPVSIRRLDPTADEALFHLAFGWLEDSPSWRRETEAVFGTLNREEYLQATLAPHRIDIGVFRGPEFIALVTLTMNAVNIYEVHFEAAPDADPKLIIQVGQSIRDQMWEYDARLFYTFTPHWNRGVLAINKALGFKPTGVIMAKGTCRGRLIDWLQYELRRP